MRSLFLPLLLAATSSVRVSAAAEPPLFRASQSGNILHVTSPYGSHLFLGDMGFDRLQDYRFEILVSDLRPSNAPPLGGNGGISEASPGQGPSSLPDDNLLIVEANRLFNSGKFAESLKFVEELLRRQPTHVRAWTMKGSLMHAMGHKDLARQAWEQGLKIDPANIPLKNALGSKP